jgi:hypothetical protein
MSDSGPRREDEPGAFSATGVDDPTPREEYGDRGERPPHAEFNDGTDGERFRRLEHDLRHDEHVDDVVIRAGGARDFARVELAGDPKDVTLPESVVSSIYCQRLAIAHMKGAIVGVTAPSQRGGES